MLLLAISQVRLPRWNFRPTQPPTLSETGNEYRSQYVDSLRLGSKGRMAHFIIMWINVWVAGKSCVIPR